MRGAKNFTVHFVTMQLTPSDFNSRGIDTRAFFARAFSRLLFCETCRKHARIYDDSGLSPLEICHCCTRYDKNSVNYRVKVPVLTTKTEGETQEKMSVTLLLTIVYV